VSYHVTVYRDSVTCSEEIHKSLPGLNNLELALCRRQEKPYGQSAITRRNRFKNFRSSHPLDRQELISTYGQYLESYPLGHQLSLTPYCIWRLNMQGSQGSYPSQQCNFIYFIQGPLPPGYATNQKVAGSIPDVVTGIFHWLNPCGHKMALGSNQPQAKEYQVIS
jgi:hypothetical protein